MELPSAGVGPEPGALRRIAGAPLQAAPASVGAATKGTLAARLACQTAPCDEAVGVKTPSLIPPALAVPLHAQGGALALRQTAKAHGAETCLPLVGPLLRVGVRAAGKVRASPRVRDAAAPPTAPRSVAVKPPHATRMGARRAHVGELGKPTDGIRRGPLSVAAGPLKDAWIRRHDPSPAGTMEPPRRRLTRPCLNGGAAPALGVIDARLPWLPRTAAALAAAYAHVATPLAGRVGVGQAACVAYAFALRVAGAAVPCAPGRLAA